MAGLFAKVIVSPTLTLDISLILADIHPTSPLISFSFLISFGVLTPSSTISASKFVAIIFILSCSFKDPSTSLT